MFLYHFSLTLARAFSSHLFHRSSISVLRFCFTNVLSVFVVVTWAFECVFVCVCKCLCLCLVYLMIHAYTYTKKHHTHPYKLPYAPYPHIERNCFEISSLSHHAIQLFPIWLHAPPLAMWILFYLFCHVYPLFVVVCGCDIYMDNKHACRFDNSVEFVATTRFAVLVLCFQYVTNTYAFSHHTQTRWWVQPNIHTHTHTASHSFAWIRYTHALLSRRSDDR